MAVSSLPLTSPSEAQRAQAQERFLIILNKEITQAEIARIHKSKSRRLPAYTLPLIEGLVLQTPLRSVASIYWKELLIVLISSTEYVSFGEKELRHMSHQPTTLHLEIPSEVAQQDVWELEEQLSQVAGTTTELREPKDIIAATLLFINIVGPYVEQAAAIAGGFAAVRDIAQIIYNFLHAEKQEKDRTQGKNKVVIIKKGKRIELYNLTLKEIERIVDR